MDSTLILQNKIEKLILATPNKSKAEVLDLILFGSENIKVESLYVVVKWELQMTLNNKIDSFKE